MTVIAQFDVDGDPDDFERVGAAFDEDVLVAIDGTNPPLVTTQVAAVRVETAELLSQFYHACVDQAVEVDVRGIQHC